MEDERNWLRTRMDELGLTSLDVAKRIDRNESTVRGWCMKGIRWALMDMSDWLRLAEILEWDFIDLVIAHGYEVDRPYPPEDMAILNRMQRIDRKKRAYCLRMIDAVLKVCESNELDDILE